MTVRGPMIRRSVELATRRPWHVIAVWAIAIVLMGIAGLGAKQVLKPENLEISGMPSTNEIKQQRGAFGRTSPLMVLLDGPQTSLDRAGPRVVRSLDRIAGVNVSSPWSPGVPELLRERPDRALLIVTINKELFD